VLGRAATEAVGRPLGEVLRKLSVLVSGVVDAPADKLELKIVDSADTRQDEVRVSHLDGRGRVIVLSDVTMHKAAEASVQASHQFVIGILHDVRAARPESRRPPPPAIPGAPIRTRRRQAVRERGCRLFHRGLSPQARGLRVTCAGPAGPER